ncbi:MULTISPECIES: hypothetical protein [unclassified Microcoleus]
MSSAKSLETKLIEKIRSLPPDKIIYRLFDCITGARTFIVSEQ